MKKNLLILGCWQDDWDIQTVKGSPEVAYFIYFLKKENPDFTYLYPAFKERREKDPRFTGVDILKIPERLKPFTPLLNVFRLFDFNEKFYKKAITLPLTHYSVVMAFCDYTALPAKRIAKSIGIPYVLKLAGITFAARMKKIERNIRLFPLEIALKTTPDKIFLIDDGSEGYEFLTRKMGIPEEKVLNLPNPRPEFSLDTIKLPEIFTIGWFSRFDRMKGTEFLIKIIKKTLEKSTDVKFLIIGFGVEALKFKKYFREKRNVKLIERGLSYLEIQRKYAEISVFISTNLYANATLPVIEALTYGRPVITFDIAGTRNLIKDGFNGFLIKSFDIEEFVEKLLFLKNNPEILRKLSSNAIKTAKKIPTWRERVLMELKELKKLSG